MLNKLARIGGLPMRSFLLNKLVRDGIVSFMLELGQKPTYRTLNDEEYIQALVAKLLEEAKEISIADPKKALKELADVLEVIETLATALGSSLTAVQNIQAEIRAQRGGFTKRNYIERLDLVDDDRWTDYYASEPERFREL